MKRLKKKERLALGLLKIGEVADLADVLPTTIRYYTDLGLLIYTDRMIGGYRLYPKEETLAMMDRISVLKAEGKSIDEIVALITKNKTNSNSDI